MPRTFGQHGHRRGNQPENPGHRAPACHAAGHARAPAGMLESAGRPYRGRGAGRCATLGLSSSSAWES